MMRAKLAVLLIPILLGLFSLQGHAAPGESLFQTDSRVDWTEGLMYLELRFTPASGTAMDPTIRGRAMEAVKKELPSLFLKEAGRINVDSRHKIEEKYLESPYLIESLKALSLDGDISRSGFDPGFTTFIQVFAYPVYPDIVELFLSHPGAVPQIPALEYVPGGNYSGIVIFVENPLPLYGTNLTVELKPALFPRIYSTHMDCIFDRYMVDPEKIKTHGMLRYYPDTRIEEIYSRVGDVPLYVHALGIFGINHTDLIVSPRAALQMRADEHSLSLLREGKVAVVYSTD
jgi:hypothetical protein